MKAKKKQWPLTTIVEVAWKDANTRGRWGSADEYRQYEAAPVLSVGYLLLHTKEKIILVQNQGVEIDDVADAICIPTPWATKIKVLRK